jgi:hypothetical protein
MGKVALEMQEQFSFVGMIRGGAYTSSYTRLGNIALVFPEPHAWDFIPRFTPLSGLLTKLTK